MDLAPKKEAIKVMIQDELTRMSEETDEDEDTNEDAGKKQQQSQAKEVEAWGFLEPRSRSTHC